MTNNTTTNVPRELKPCPFCGDSELLGFEPSNEGGWTIVRCRRCGASGSTGRSTSEWEAAAYWNRRDPSPAGVDADHIEDVRAMVADPSPAGVDGLNTDRNAAFKACPESGCDWGSFYLGWKARGEVEQAIIDGLAVENHQLRRELNLRQSQIESSDHIAERAQRFAVQLRTERDQQARRIGELEGLLLEVAASLAWNAHGECRAIHDGPIMPSQMALDAVKAALGGSL